MVSCNGLASYPGCIFTSCTAMPGSIATQTRTKQLLYECYRQIWTTKERVLTCTLGDDVQLLWLFNIIINIINLLHYNLKNEFPVSWCPVFQGTMVRYLCFQALMGPDHMHNSDCDAGSMLHIGHWRKAAYLATNPRLCTKKVRLFCSKIKGRTAVDKGFQGTKPTEKNWQHTWPKWKIY